MTLSRNRAIERLAALHGVQSTYRSVRTGRRERASQETLLAILRALGAPVTVANDADGALRAVAAERAARVLPKTIVAWDGVAPAVPVALPKTAGRARVELVLETEDGGISRWEVSSSARTVRIPRSLPPGAHTLRARWGSESRDAHVLSAPRRLDVRGKPRRRAWGTFLPLYAARSDRDWGCGSLTELEAHAEFTRERGGSLVATLPMFATYLSTPFDPSPYAPVSRLFWNEHFLDLPSLPEFARSARARAIASTASGELASLRAAPLVDWRRMAALRRLVLDALADEFFERGGDDRRRLEARLEQDPHLLAYARFRSAVEARGTGWRLWPERIRRAELAARDAPEKAARVHLYAQFRFEEALSALAARLRGDGTALYLDLPLGVHADGFDPWRFPDRFAEGVSGGAPPDHYSGLGQDWGFPPLHPEGARANGHAYFRLCLRNLLRHASVLRIDHVMSLHRLWWVPRGFPPAAGAYVEYPAEELYAALCLEASRAGAAIVGEDLGTVPPPVRPAMRRHGLRRTWAVQRELASDPDGAFTAVPAASAAALNTHDHPTFAGWWSGTDIGERVRLGFLDANGERRETKRRAIARRALRKLLGKRQQSATAPIRETLAALGRTRAEWVVVSLEDLWGETRPQNVPGTTDERPNWRRKARWSLEYLARSKTVRETMTALDRARRGEDRS